jgi:hypothetical protein
MPGDSLFLFARTLALDESSPAQPSGADQIVKAIRQRRILALSYAARKRGRGIARRENKAGHWRG